MRVGRNQTCEYRPGTTSCFVRKAGTKKLWITSSEVIVSRTARPSGTCSSFSSRLPPGCRISHIHCRPRTYSSDASPGGR